MDEVAKRDKKILDDVIARSRMPDQCAELLPVPAGKIACDYISKNGGELVNGFLVIREEAEPWVLVKPYTVVRDEGKVLRDPASFRANAGEQVFVEHVGDQEDFVAFSKRHPETKSEVPLTVFSVNQVKFLVSGFFVIIVLSAIMLSHYTVGYGPVADFLGYVLPCLAAALVGGKLYLKDKVSDLGMYEGAVFFLFLGVLSNAYVHPCGSAIIVLICLLSAVLSVILLLWRVVCFHGDEGAFRLYFAGLSPYFLLAMVLVVAIFSWAFWDALFVKVVNQNQCLPPPPH
ncbi:hypothetical protein [Dyella sp. EPa41]|uniref:hypothetical protein n=1 Tax=Dyella sp. EPa41 TaxID=1561194 RepID=UPI001915990F|nr:hypothetical protein [Dyella sp. EPa41]